MAAGKTKRIMILGIALVVATVAWGWRSAGKADERKGGGGPRPAPTDKDAGKKEVPPIAQPAKKPHPNVAIRESMSKPVDIDKAIEAPLKDVLEFISDRFNLTLIVNDVAFKSLEPPLENVGETHVKLPKMPHVNLYTVLRLVLSGIKGTYIVREGFVEILTPEAVRELIKTPVHVTAKQQTLADVLEDLSEQTGANIVLDLRAEEKAQTLVTATLQDISLQNAVNVLSNMADLKSVVFDNVILVTTAENAEEMRREYFRGAMHDQTLKALRAMESTDPSGVPKNRASFKDALEQLKLVTPGSEKPALKTDPKR
jgi:hypothetical protein